MGGDWGEVEVSGRRGQRRITCQGVDLRGRVRCRYGGWGESLEKGSWGLAAAEEGMSSWHLNKLEKKGGWQLGRTGHRACSARQFRLSLYISIQYIISSLANSKSLQMGLPASSLAPLIYSQNNSQRDSVQLFKSDHVIPCSLQPHYSNFCSQMQ